ncbi:rhomboid family intramembrane serine protease [Phycisphaera mikurensis]|uniref:Rhomboid family protein n=1 Tax=Phycisphaera mikurensis (strain NBRC 102666 / KCTC 22515 / FYK2301M01) TaxID=1142394 RepID=I0IJ93_PHYMF|nr:rhomboid family intramembrane serine protease [Phycisphaera mikurensis]MBB6441869.1 membrane associated rhomboid family serine protease [Phycisphaera mikurensis]BAM05331.1 rhomboid family protein [Phycisphaera mikurensis NBRC 102666]
MLFFPLGTDRPLRAMPWLTYAIIGLNVLVFLVSERSILALGDQMTQLQESLNAGIQRPDLLAGWNSNLVYTSYLQPAYPRLHQFFTYPFLHQNLWHLTGNMVFLYAFGCAVEDRLGKLPYLLFYLAGGVLAGWAHVLTSSSPVLGASGSVAAVTGIFLALFPRLDVTIWYWFLIAIGRFEVSAVVLICFRVGQDLLFNLLSIGNVAYEAHLAGYLTGFLVGMFLLMTRLLPGEDSDMLSTLAQRRRAKADRAGGGSAAPPAADAGAELDAANAMSADGRPAEAAAAYEGFLRRHPADPQAPRVALLAALLHARDLGNPRRAAELLGPAVAKLGGADRELAEKVLAGARAATD